MTARYSKLPPGFGRTVHALIESKTKPVGALGLVESVALQLARATGQTQPRLRSCELTIIAADHGIAADGVSVYPQAVTRQMVMNFLGGGAAANVFADAVGASVRVVDAGVAGEPVDHPDLLSRRIGAGTRNSRLEPAMTEAQRDEALRVGAALADESETDVLCLGEMGIGNTSAASLVAHKLLELPLTRLVGRGTGLDDEGVARKRGLLERAAERTPRTLGAARALAEYGGFEIVMMTGAMMAGARSNRPVLVDGFISSVAALAALHLEPVAERALIYAHRSAEAGHKVMLEALGARPILDFEMRLGEGTGALLAWPIVRAAAAMLSDMASFESAGISGPA